MSQAGASHRRSARSRFDLREFQKDIDGYNAKLEGMLQWPLRSSIPASRPRSRISAVRATSISASRSAARMDRLALRAANLLVGNDEGAAVSKRSSSDRQLEFTSDALVAVTGAEMPVKLDGVEQPSWTALKVKAGQVLSLRLPEVRRAHLYRDRRWHRRARGARQPLDLSDRRARRLQGPGDRQGRRTARRRGRWRQGRRQLSGGAAPQARQAGRAARPAGALLASDHRGVAGRTSSTTTGRSRPEADRMGYRFRGGATARLRGARAAVRRRLRPVQHRRQLLSLRLDPGAGRHRTDHPASRRGLRRRLLHGRHGHLGRHGPDRPVAAEYAGPFRQGRHGRRSKARADRSALLARIRETLQ